MIAYVVSGIGFLGAAAGSNMYTISILATLFILSINIFLRPIINTIDRKLINNQTEITHNINIIINIGDTKKVVQPMREILASVNIQMQDFSINSFGHEEVIIKAVLVVTSITQEEMNDILNELNSISEVEYAFCSLM